MVETESQFKIALRLARLRDRSLGQAEEIEALFDVLNGSERLLKMSNDSLTQLFKGKRPSPSFIQQTTFDILTDVVDALSRFFDARTIRIKLILDYLKLAGRDMSKELEQLKQFEILYDDVKREHARIKYEFMEKPLSKYTLDTMNEFKSFQDVIATKGISTVRRLKEMEQTLEGEIMDQVSIFVKANTVFDTNELYSLLLDDP